MRCDYASEETKRTQLSHSHVPNAQNAKSRRYSRAAAEPAFPSTD